MQYTTDYSGNGSRASILPMVKFGDIVWWVDPAGNTHTGQVKSVEMIDGVLWAAALYQQCAESLPHCFILENRHAFEFFSGVSPDFPLKFGQSVWFGGGKVWQAGTVAGFSIIFNKWYAEIRFFNGISPDYVLKPLKDVRTSAPGLSEDIEYLTWLNELVLI